MEAVYKFDASNSRFQFECSQVYATYKTRLGNVYNKSWNCFGRKQVGTRAPPLTTLTYLVGLAKWCLNWSLMQMHADIRTLLIVAGTCRFFCTDLLGMLLYCLDALPVLPVKTGLCVYSHRMVEGKWYQCSFWENLIFWYLITVVWFESVHLVMGWPLFQDSS